MPRTAIKGQVLADLVAEFAEPTVEGVDVSGSPNNDRRLVSAISVQEHDEWRAYIDGAANQKGSGVGLVLISPEGITLEKSLRLGFQATNNEAEYEALLEGMLMIRKLEKSLDLLEERRDCAMVHLAQYQQKLKRGYDAKVKSRPLTPGDLVLRKVLGNARNPAWGKLGPNWEGPYRITSVAGIGAYYLEDLDERVVPRPWNVNNLKRYFY
ncbi:uncharacterized protein LOC126720006 [Quercus robur]|uniref:uncharacterized protein LOC126720006 n=1 Tax=Quercus robur TaxID=38942 RepID=UPI0021639E2C|nr:uncharacterized protein LOC126720006 [Quercus robur]